MEEIVLEIGSTREGEISRKQYRASRVRQDLLISSCIPLGFVTDEYKLLAVAEQKIAHCDGSDLQTV